MINDDKQALLNNTCTIPFRLTFTINEETHVIREDNIIEINYEDYRYVDTQSLVVGQFVARKITGSISTLDYDINIENTDVQVEMGIQKNNSNTIDWYSLGNFLITKPSDNDVKDIINFEALDYTKKFNVEFDPTNVTFPCTALELAEAVCEQCGVELGNDDFTNYDFIIPDNQYAEKESCRKVMQDIGKLAFSWVRIGWDNKCYIDFSMNNTIDQYNEITTDKYYDLTKQNNVFGPVNRIVIGMSNVEGENVVIEDPESIAEYGVTELQIYDNNITYTPELRQACKEGGRKLFGLAYLPLEITTVGHPWLIGNEKIKITDTKNNIIYTYPFNRTISYMGHIKTKLESKADTKTETEYRNTDNLETEVKKTRIIVDKQEGEIQELASKIVDISGEKTGTGVVILENAHKGPLHKLSIIGDVSLLYPRDNLYPKNTLYPLNGCILKIDNTYYNLDIDYLRYMSSTIYDEFIYEDGKCNIIRRVGINNGEMYALQNEIIEPREDIILNVDTNSDIRLLSFPNVTISVEYLLENEYTDVFASQVEVKSEIKTTADGINLEVSKKVDENEIISKINQTPEQISINANKIKLEGYTTINNGFSIDENGNASMNKARITGGRLLLDPGEITANLKIGEADFFEDIITLQGRDSYQKDSQGHDLLLYEATIQRPTYDGSKQGIISLTSGQTEDASLVCDKNGSHVSLRHDNNVIWLDTNSIDSNEPYLDISSNNGRTFASTNGIWSPAFINTSTKDTKKNIKDFKKNALNLIKNTDLYEYNYKGEKTKDKKHIGIVIGKNYNYPKDILSNDGKGVDLYSMVSICFKAIQEQQEQIEKLQQELQKLKEEK